MQDMSNLREGDRIVLSSSQAWTMPVDRPWLRDGVRAGLRVVRFVRATGDLVVHLDDDGHEETVRMRDVAWSSPLPAIGDDGAVALVHACLNSKDAPVLLHVRTTDATGITAIAVDTVVDAGLPRFGAVAETMRVLLPDLHAFPGDLVVAMGHRVEFDDGMAIHAFDHAETIATGMTTTRAHALFAQSPIARFTRLRIARPCDVQRRREEAWAATFPDQAIVLITKQEGDVIARMRFLASSGRTLFQSDDPENDFGGSCARGLWVFENVRWWENESHEGEKDGGMEADWRPVTREDAAAFGLTAAEIGRLIPRVAGDETDSMGDLDIFDHHAAMARRTAADADIDDRIGA